MAHLKKMSGCVCVDEGRKRMPIGGAVVKKEMIQETRPLSGQLLAIIRWRKQV